MSIQIHKLDFDPAAPGDNQRVGAFIVSASGTVIDDTAGALDVNIASASGLGIFAEDAAHTSADLGQHVLAVRQDTLSALTSATGDYSSLKVDATGQLYVTDLDAIAELQSILADTTTIAGDTTSIDATLTALSKEEDSAHSSTDRGIMALSVRSDAGGSLVSADGDYAPLQVDANGLLRVSAQVVGSVNDDAVDSGAPIKVGSRAYSTASALAALSASGDRADLLSDLYRQLFVRDSHDRAIQVTQDDVTTTAAEVLATPLAGRKTILIQNKGSKEVYIGHTSGVTAADGIEIPKHASMEFKFGEAINIFMIAASGTQDVRFLEAA